MHHFIFPSQDTFITNTIGFESSNFGLDEILNVGTKDIVTKIISPTSLFPISQSVSNLCVQNFSGSIFGTSLFGTASNVIANISSSILTDLSSSNFNGEVTASITGSNFTGSLINFSGSLLGEFSGSISGTFQSNYLESFNGNVINFTGKIISGNIIGYDIIPRQTTNISSNVYTNRALVQFDITSISNSLSVGDINNPNFRLKLKVAREFKLPIQYNLYAFPISESWVMGDGYISDNGSSNGASWIYRDSMNGTPWSTTGSSYVQFLSATQSFNYQVGDINMDVTNIVNAWISGTIKNNGILLISGDEVVPTGSGMNLYFFSKDTNTIYEPILDVSWDDFTWSTGSLTTASVNITTISAGLLGITSDSASISGSLMGGFTGLGNITTDYSTTSASGLISVMGVNGNIISMSINGNFIGSVSQSIDSIVRNCTNCTPLFDAGFNYTGGGQYQGQYQGHDIYGWGHPFNEFNQYNWTSDHLYQQEFGPGPSGPCVGNNCSGSTFTSSFLYGTLTDGTFSGSVFTSSLISGYILGYGMLTGSWNESMLLGTEISSDYPFKIIYPSSMMVTLLGTYLSGSAFGSITHLSASYGVNNYGIFDGVMIGGPFVGSKIYIPFSGSILSSSYSYTSSLNIASYSLNPVDVRHTFDIVVQNIPSNVKAGDLVKVNVFGRPRFPLKDFNRQTQFNQFLIPQYLPTSSYYAIKDNQTEEIILDFDNYTQISCDSNGNYFLLDTTSYPQERYFKVLIRIEQSGSIYTFDNGNTFKIVR